MGDEESNDAKTEEDDKGAIDLDMIGAGAESVASGFGLPDQAAEGIAFIAEGAGLLVDEYVLDAAIDVDG